MNTKIFRPLTFGILVFASACAQDLPDKPILRVEEGRHSAKISRMDVDAAERFLVTGSSDKTARVWDLATGRQLAVLRPPIGVGNDGMVYAVAISPDARTVAVGGQQGFFAKKPATTQPNCGGFELYMFRHTCLMRWAPTHGPLGFGLLAGLYVYPPLSADYSRRDGKSPKCREWA